MLLFFKILKKKWGDVKLWIHLNFRYPYKKHFSNIKSIIPVGLEIKEGIIIEENVVILKHLKELGKNVYIGNDTHIGLCRKIGSFSSISFGVKIGLRNHPLQSVSTSPVFYGARRGWVKENKLPITDEMMVEIGHDVLISANVVILEGVKIGTGAVIAAGAVVSRNIEPYSIVGGVPAKLIRYRFDEAIRTELLKSKWWEMGDEKLIELVNLADQPENFLIQLKRIQEKK
jgi:virginiamycin A acetyltransferase